MIDQKVIEEIKARNPIEDVMSAYVTMKRAGGNMLCSCPFHSEKTPSCTIFLGEQNFHCFGCGAGGDVITFVRRIENLEYVEALEFLARRVGITIPQDTRYSGEPRVDRKRFYEMNRDAASFFREKLFEPEGSAALEYLSQKRGFSRATITRFGLGYAPSNYGVFTKHMLSLGYKESELVSGFLCGKRDGRIFDYFRNRVMFPIIDVSKNVIAFGGRVMDDSLPKYLNSSDTPVFKKRNNLYAINYAKNFSSEEMILCEGYMDVIAMHAAGFENSVATLGTAITPEHARMLARYTKKVIIAYDSDEAGKRAADKAFDLLSTVDLKARVLKMSGAKDPDEYIKKFGAESFKKIISDSKSRFEYTLDGILSKYDIGINEQKVSAAAEACEFIAKVFSEAEREVYISEASSRIGISAESLKNDIKRIISRKTREDKKKVSNELYRHTAGYGNRVNMDYAKNVKAARAEEEILALLLLFEEYVHKACKADYPLLTVDDFVTEYGKKVFSAIKNLFDADLYTPSALGEFLTVEEIGRLNDLEYKRRQLTDNSEDVLRGYIEALKAEAHTSGGKDDMDLINEILKRKRK